GGAPIPADKAHATRALYLATQAKDAAVPHYQHAEVGYNYRLSNVLAGLGRGQLEDLDDRVKGRRTLYRKYAERFRLLDFLSVGPDEPAGFQSNRWLTTVLLDAAFAPDQSPEHLRQHLETFNIESRPLWKPLHRQPAFAGAPAYGGAVSEGLFARGLCLPSGNGMTPADLDRVVTAVMRF
ncbi:MAG: DegT/DnrJ/EryC1/StrS family aminotransferase, partial [Hymenobacteraceae bacterium]|nr:DegT/DnrJ/EryC1/StrS family aminotransferase [Hymenobacteraceae bacterium]